MYTKWAHGGILAHRFCVSAPYDHPNSDNSGRKSHNDLI